MLDFIVSKDNFGAKFVSYTGDSTPHDAGFGTLESSKQQSKYVTDTLQNYLGKNDKQI
jgi:hypothetical protein